LKASTKQEVKLQDLVVPVNNKHLDHFILVVYFAIHLYLEALEMLKYLSDYFPGQKLKMSLVNTHGVQVF